MTFWSLKKLQWSNEKCYVLTAANGRFSFDSRCFALLYICSPVLFWSLYLPATTFLTCWRQHSWPHRWCCHGSTCWAPGRLWCRRACRWRHPTLLRTRSRSGNTLKRWCQTHGRWRSVGRWRCEHPKAEEKLWFFGGVDINQLHRKVKIGPRKRFLPLLKRRRRQRQKFYSQGSGWNTKL